MGVVGCGVVWWVGVGLGVGDKSGRRLKTPDRMNTWAQSGCPRAREEQQDEAGSRQAEKAYSPFRVPGSSRLLRQPC